LKYETKRWFFSSILPRFQSFVKEISTKYGKKSHEIKQKAP